MKEDDLKQSVRNLIKYLPYCIEWVPGEEPTRIHEIGASGEKMPLKCCGKPATMTDVYGKYRIAEHAMAFYCDKHPKGVDVGYAEALRVLLKEIEE